MRSLILLWISFSFFQHTSDPEKRNPLIKVYKNDIEKIYTVFFADTIQREITIGLRDKKNQVLIEEVFNEKGFSKKYSLSQLKNDPYEFFILYDDTSFVESIELKSEKQILAEAISLKADYPTLHVNVSPYNMDPMNIFIYTPSDRLLKMFYWEPNAKLPNKQIDLSPFEGYEVRVQIVQDGEDKLEQLIPLY